MAAAVSFVGMAVAGWTQGVVISVVVAVLLGLTIASYASLMQTMAVEAAPAEHSGSSIGYISIGTATGAMVGPPLFGAVIDATGRFSDGWLMTGAVVACGVIVFMIGFRERPTKSV